LSAGAAAAFVREDGLTNIAPTSAAIIARARSTKKTLLTLRRALRLACAVGELIFFSCKFLWLSPEILRISKKLLSGGVKDVVGRFV
jgi:hypothetical protein